jgi:hypothetical protein
VSYNESALPGDEDGLAAYGNGVGPGGDSFAPVPAESVTLNRSADTLTVRWEGGTSGLVTVAERSV